MKPESKYDKFKRLANQRGNRVLKDLELLGNLGNQNNYYYTEADIRKLFSTIEEEFRQARMRFKQSKKREIKF